MLDHREIGRQLDLFMFSELSPGCPIWLPAGNAIYSVLSDKIRNLNYRNGYVEVRTPVLWKTQLYEQSGHLEHYRKNMFLIEHRLSPLGEPFEWDTAAYAMKPMNCPGHMVIFKSKRFSYRDLPYRIHDQGILHRNEASGSLGGLTRCKAFCQDDAHCFIKPEDVQNEILSIMNMIGDVYRAFDMRSRAVLSTRPNNFMGDLNVWEQAESNLVDALNEARLSFEYDVGGGAFYGPKIDVMVKDSLGREWQTATIQLDFQLPERFELEYVAEDGSMKRPIVVHRAMYGSFERFIGILLEHYQGRLPTWLSPTQVIFLPISDRHIEYCKRKAEELRKLGIRHEVDEKNGTLNQKVLIAQQRQIPYILVCGDKEVEQDSFSVRKLDGSNQFMKDWMFFQHIEHDNIFQFGEVKGL
jgi:threonyl-tRNA synthetase